MPARIHEALESHESHVLALQSSLRAGSDARATATRQQNGFTLMELLIVISIILILMLVAIPTAGKIRKHANELSAQNSLQTIQEAEIHVRVHLSRPTATRAACRPSAATPTPARPAPPPPADHQWRPRHRHQIRLHLHHHQLHQGTVNNTDRITSYTATAVPPHLGKTGDRGFCLDSGGAMKADPAGGTNCTQMVQ